MGSVDERLSVLETKVAHGEQDINELKSSNKMIVTRLDTNEKDIVEIKSDTKYIREIVDKLDKRAEEENKKDRDELRKFKNKCLAIGIGGGLGAVGVLKAISMLFS